MRVLTLVSLIGVCLFALGCKAFRSDGTSMSDYAKSQAIPTASGNRDSGSSGVAQVSYDEEEYESEDEDDGFTVDDLSPAALGQSAKKLVGQGPNRDVAKRLYAEAEEQYAEALQLKKSGGDESEVRKKFRQAGDTYTSAAKRYPNSTIEQDSLYQAGEAYFFGDSYDKANQSFEKLIENYAGTRYLDRAEARRFSIARYWLELDEFKPDNFFSYNATNPERPRRDTDGHARRVLNKIRLDDPTGKLADDATMALGNAHFRDANYLDAADAYEDLRKAYPGSPHVFNAAMLEIRARLEAYRGPAYDGTGVQKAERLLKDVVSQFPTKVADQRSALDELAAEIRFRLAEREMHLARLYERREENRAARLHYAKIVTEFSDTSLAEEAQSRLTELSDAPDLPPQRLKWLVDLLPKPKDQKPLFNDDVPR